MMTRVILMLMLALGLISMRVKIADDGGMETDPIPHCYPCK